MTPSPDHVLSRYPPFAIGLTPKVRYELRWPGPTNLSLAVAFGVAFLLAGYREGTLVMAGPGVGLLEHPGIWLFLAAQMVIPAVVNRSLRRFRSLPNEGDSPFTAQFLTDSFKEIDGNVTCSLTRTGRRSKAVYQVLILLGFIAWTWNTFQNQQPMRFLHFDFWDSIHHPLGYWLTRFYKLYVWVLIGPAVVHAQICLVRGARSLFARAATEKGIVLDPYHSDGEGGLGVVVDTVINPMVPLVLASSFLTVAAFWVHGKYDVTTIGGLAMTIALLLLIYFVPAISLRRAIIEEKRRQQEHVCKIQRTMYSDLLAANVTSQFLKEQTSALVSLADLSRRITSISHWPQMARIWRLAAIALGSPLLGWAFKQLQAFIPSVANVS